MCNCVDLIVGYGWFIDLYIIFVEDQVCREKIIVIGDYIIIVIGIRLVWLFGVEFDEEWVFDFDGIFDFKLLLFLMVVVGVGVIGIEYVFMFVVLGIKVIVVEKWDNMLDFCDFEVVEVLKFYLCDLVVIFWFGEEVIVVDVGFVGIVIILVSGKQILVEIVMYLVGCQG